jgi:hypothetical protein
VAFIRFVSIANDGAFLRVRNFNRIVFIYIDNLYEITNLLELLAYQMIKIFRANTLLIGKSNHSK